jgi:hypothetical protein
MHAVELSAQPASGGDPPAALLRLRFADALALERAGAAFGAGSGPGFGAACLEPATLTLQIPGDAGIATLRAVLAVLDSAAITAESLTVHTHSRQGAVPSPLRRAELRAQLQRCSPHAACAGPRSPHRSCWAA